MAPIHFLCSQIFSAGMNLVQHATAVENTFEDDTLDDIMTQFQHRHQQTGAGVA